MPQTDLKIGYNYRTGRYGLVKGDDALPHPTSQRLDPVQQLRQAADLGNRERSVRWFRDKIRQLGRSNFIPQKVILSDVGTIENNLQLGSMYFYQYSAKTAATLPYWDAFPLVLPFQIAKGGWYGINLHYLPPQWRTELLVRLMEYTNSPRSTEQMKFRLSWKLLENFARFPESKFCTKQYLENYVKSNMLRIHPNDWKMVINLPIDAFQKKSRNTVWQDAQKYAKP